MSTKERLQSHSKKKLKKQKSRHNRKQISGTKKAPSRQKQIWKKAEIALDKKVEVRYDRKPLEKANREPETEKVIDVKSKK
jgi:hypothetical protein